jgi:hypothetical protein
VLLRFAVNKFYSSMAHAMAPKSLRSPFSQRCELFPPCAAKQVRLRRYTSTRLPPFWPARYSTSPFREYCSQTRYRSYRICGMIFAEFFEDAADCMTPNLMQCARRSINRFRSTGLRRSSSPESAPCGRFVWPSQGTLVTACRSHRRLDCTRGSRITRNSSSPFWLARFSS